jgi:predicted nucleic-acid-binding protein
MCICAKASLQVPKGELAEMLDNVLRYPGIVNTDKPSLREALKLYATNNMDFVDCMLVAKARTGEMELVTFDQGLRKLNHL